MRILYHHRTLSEDGQAVHIRALQRAFEEQGHVVEEVSLVRQGAGARPQGAGARPSGGEGHGEGGGAGSARTNGRVARPSAGRGRWGWVTRLPRFARELAEYGYNGVARRRIVGAAARFEPDFLYERYAFGNVAGVLAARRLGIPLVLEVNSPMVVELERTRGLSFPGLARRVERFTFCGADRVCVVTGVLRDMLVDEGVDPDRLLVTPNGVHLELYADCGTEGARARARAALGLAELPDEAPVLGFVGYYRDWHRLDLVVEGLAGGELGGAHLALVGGGPAEASLRALAESLGVAGRVHFCGRREHGDVPGLLPAFDVALVPAINPYASPLKLHEYMAAGRAVVAPDQPNLREVIEHGSNGLLVRPGDREALCDAVSRLARDPGLRARLGERARATIAERDLTWRGNARRVVASLEGAS